LSPNYADDGIVLAGTEAHGLIRSNDNGRTWARLGEDAITDSVNGLIVSRDFPATPDILAMLGDRLLVSRDGGVSWFDWHTGLVIEHGLSSIVAPLGIAPGAPLLVGCMTEGGGIVRV
jgi:photosystem II stability/assembly factor-like uncharacterized protein